MVCGDCARALQRLAKRQDTALLLVGHVTKGHAGPAPKVLEHLLMPCYFEGDVSAARLLAGSEETLRRHGGNWGCLNARSGAR